MAKKMDVDSGNTNEDDANYLTMILLSGSLHCSARVQQMIH